LWRWRLIISGPQLRSCAPSGSNCLGVFHFEVEYGLNATMVRRTWKCSSYDGNFDSTAVRRPFDCL